MGILKDTFRVLNEIVTLGGTGRLEEAKENYSKSFDEYKPLIDKINEFKININENISSIGHVLTNAAGYIKKSEILITRGIENPTGLNFDSAKNTLHEIKRFDREFSSAVSVGVGAAAGGTLAVGSWAMVAAFGSASTGFAITGLSGVAATNATLAWFGGGALAAGGAGMSGGIAVLGGIAALPLFYFAAKGTHGKAKKFELEKVKLDESIVMAKAEIKSLPAVLDEIEMRRIELNEICNDFISSVERLILIIRPQGIWSLLKQKILTMFRKNPYTKKQSDALDNLVRCNSQFLEKFQKYTRASSAA